jgi:low temperature requirement protein LtrA
MKPQSGIGSPPEDRPPVAGRARRARRYRAVHRIRSPERYSVFTTILLGESVAVSTGIADVIGSGLRASIVVVAGSGLVLLFALWWLDEREPSADGLSTRRGRAFLWATAHYGVFAALAALGAGLEVAVRHTETHDALGTGYAVAIPTSAFLVLLWLSHSAIVPRSQVRASVVFGGAVLVLLAPLVGAGAGVGVVAALIALVAAATVAATIVCSRTRRHPQRVIAG